MILGDRSCPTPSYAASGSRKLLPQSSKLVLASPLRRPRCSWFASLIPPDGVTHVLHLTPIPQTDGRHRARAVQMDRAKTPPQSGLVTRLGGEERPLTDRRREDAALPVCREAITTVSTSRPSRVAAPRARERVSHGPDSCAFGVLETLHPGNSAWDNSEGMT